MARSKNKKKTNIQIVYSEPRKILVGTKLTRKGQRLKLSNAPIEEINKYRKNVYEINHNAKEIKKIKHKHWFKKK